MKFLQKPVENSWENDQNDCWNPSPNPSHVEERGWGQGFTSIVHHMSTHSHDLATLSPSYPSQKFNPSYNLRHTLPFTKSTHAIHIDVLAMKTIIGVHLSSKFSDFDSLTLDFASKNSTPNPKVSNHYHVSAIVSPK